MDYKKYNIKCRNSIFLISFSLNNEVAFGIDLEITQGVNTVLEKGLSCNELPQQLQSLHLCQETFQ